MMVAAADNVLGKGIYTPHDAALYARVSTPLLSRWLWGTKTATAVVHPQFKDDEKIVSFLDFVQALAIRAIRLELRLPLQKIREAVEKATQDYGEPFPFARAHKTFLFRRELLIDLSQREYVQLTGVHRDNRMITEVVELYMRDLSFDATGLARSYNAFSWRDLTIVMDPQRRFGEPLVTSCGYSAMSLWEAAKNEGSMDAAAAAYGVRPDEVEIACRYFDHLSGLGNSAA